MTRSRLVRHITACLLALSCAAMVACGGPAVEGTYTNANAQATLDVKAGDQASFTVMGDTQSCTYKRESATLTLTCPGQQTFIFSIAADGTLTSDGAFGALTKSK